MAPSNMSGLYHSLWCKHVRLPANPHESCTPGYRSPHEFVAVLRLEPCLVLCAWLWSSIVNKGHRMESRRTFCRFTDADILASINYRGNGYICRWKALTGGLYRQMALSSAMPAAITGLDVSPSGELLGIANAEGHSCLLQTMNLSVRLRNKKAHMVFGTDVAFAPHGEAFLSVSGDASARVNMVPEPRSLLRPLLWLLFLAGLVFVALAILEDMGMLQGELGSQLAPVIQHVRSAVDAMAESLRDRVESSLRSRPISL